MDTADQHVPVVIVGAGPVGLSLALGLARHGVRSTLVEREETTSEHSKAGGIHVRTREALRAWGVEESFLEEGHLVRAVTLRDPDDGRPIATTDFSLLDGEAGRPGLLMLPQSRTEALLLEAVSASGHCEVRFATEAIDVVQDASGATVTVRDAVGERQLTAAYVVGCDGAGSTVRDALGLPFEGMTYSLRPMLADVHVDDERDSLPWPRLRNDASGVTSCLRIGPGLWRIIRLEQTSADGADEVATLEVGRRVGEVLGPGPFEVVWASRFRIHRRSAPRFRTGRVLLAGDAAHVHSPVGGLGMNAGMQDAHNLAWKLAGALDGGDVDRLLDSYDVERRAVVVGSVSRYTDLVTRVFLQSPVAVRRTALSLLGVALRSSRVQRTAARRTAMLDLDYPSSPLLSRRDRSAGRRLPDPLLRSADGHRVRLHDLLPPGPALLAVDRDPSEARGTGVGSVVRIGAGGHVDPSGRIRALLGPRSGWILVRPDGHVAWARSDPEGLGAAVRRAVGALPPGATGGEQTT